MRIDEIKAIISRASVIRIHNPLNPLLSLSVVSTPICWIAAYMFQTDAVPKYSFVILGTLPIFGSIIAYFLFFWVDRNCLQSEEFVLKQRELSLIERKGREPIAYDFEIGETEAIP